MIPPTNAASKKNTFQANVDRKPPIKLQPNLQLGVPPDATGSRSLLHPPDGRSSMHPVLAHSNTRLPRHGPPPPKQKTYTNGALTHTRTRSSPRRSWLDRFGWSKAVSRWAYLSCRVVGENNEGPAPPRAAQINGGGPLKKIWYLSCQATINCATLSTEHNGHDVPPTTPISTLCSGGGSTLPRAASLIIVRSAQ